MRLQRVWTRAQRRDADAFAQRIEATPSGTHPGDDPLDELVELTRALPALSRSVAPTDPFRRALRERLVAAEIEPEPASGRPAGRSRRRLAWGLTGSVGILALGGVGVANASENALPGDALYGVKRSLEDTRLALALDDVSKGRLYLREADRRLREAEALLGQPGREGDVEQVLSDMEEDVRQGSSKVAAAPGPEAAEAVQALNAFAVDSSTRLQQLSRTLPVSQSSLRAALSRAGTTAACSVGCHGGVSKPAPTPVPQPSGQPSTPVSDPPVVVTDAPVPSDPTTVAPPVSPDPSETPVPEPSPTPTDLLPTTDLPLPLPVPSSSSPAEVGSPT